MKKTILLLSAALLAGCTTTPLINNPDGTTSMPVTTPDIPRIAAVTEEIVRMGTAETLAQKPDLLPYFQTALGELNVLAASKTVTPALLISVINQLPVKELKGNDAVLAFEAARILLAATGWSTVDITRASQLLPIVLAMRDGLVAAGVAPLGPPPAAPVPDVPLLNVPVTPIEEQPTAPIP